MSKDPKPGPPIRPGRDTRAMGIIEGVVGRVYMGKLAEAGVRTADDLLMRGATPQGRDELSKTTGIPQAIILRWVNRVDLMRIDGVGSEYSDLLREAGIESTAELARRVSAEVAALLIEINAKEKRVRIVPGEETVAGWIAQARKLLRVGGS